MKSITVILCATLLAFTLALGISAAPNELYHSLSDVQSGSELAGVMSDIKESSLIADADFDGAYKVRSMTPGEFLSLASGETQSADVSGSDTGVFWYLVSDDGALAKVGMTNGKWNVLGKSTETEVNMTASDIGNFLSAAPAYAGAYCIDVPEYHTSFIYFENSDGRYVIPFGSRPDLTGLENGISYAIADAADLLTQCFGSPEAANADIYGGASGNVNDSEIITTAVIASVCALALLATVVGAFLVFKRKKTVSVYFFT